MPVTMGEQSHCDQRDKGKGKADQRDVTVSLMKTYHTANWL